MLQRALAGLAVGIPLCLALTGEAQAFCNPSANWTSCTTTTYTRSSGVDYGSAAAAAVGLAGTALGIVGTILENVPSPSLPEPSYSAPSYESPSYSGSPASGVNNIAGAAEQTGRNLIGNVFSATNREDPNDPRSPAYRGPRQQPTQQQQTTSNSGCSTITSRDMPSSGPCPTNTGSNRRLPPQLRGPANAQPLTRNRRAQLASAAADGPDDPSVALIGRLLGNRNDPDPPVVRDNAPGLPPTATRTATATATATNRCTFDSARSNNVSDGVRIVPELIKEFRNAFTHSYSDRRFNRDTYMFSNLALSWQKDVKENGQAVVDKLGEIVNDYHSACDSRKEAIARQAQQEFRRYYNDSIRKVGAEIEACQRAAQDRDRAVNAARGDLQRAKVTREWAARLKAQGCADDGTPLTLHFSDLSKFEALRRSLL